MYLTVWGTYVRVEINVKDMTTDEVHICVYVCTYVCMTFCLTVNFQY